MAGMSQRMAQALLSAAAATAKAAWAVGAAARGPLLPHWNGTRRAIVTVSLG